MSRPDILALGGYFEDVGDDPDDVYLKRFSPDVSVALCDEVAVAIAASDECFYDDVNLIGLPLEAAAWRLGGVAGADGRRRRGDLRHGDRSGALCPRWVRFKGGPL